ncbi:MAG: phosphoribosyl-AMP cyclohydrolase [Opitutales bacterium]|nr:phosphoribosyl-AMP cyclohydrolase [Opitutales bacterium]
MAFDKRESVLQVEEGNSLAPKFDENGLIPCICQHATTREILMFAYMNADALEATLKTGRAHYWSRSRHKLWKKGETSGMTQQVNRVLIDDDQDCVVIEVDLASPTAGGQEASCHVGYRSCFYRKIELVEESNVRELVFIESAKAFDPTTVYADTPNPTQL